MAWCHQATSHYSNHCSPRSISPYGITRLQWVNKPPGLRKGTVTMVWKMVDISTDHVSPKCNGALGKPNLYLDQPITKAWYQPIGGHVSYPTDSRIATRLGLCISLCWPDSSSPWSVMSWYVVSALVITSYAEALKLTKHRISYLLPLILMVIYLCVCVCLIFFFSIMEMVKYI